MGRDLTAEIPQVQQQPGCPTLVGIVTQVAWGYGQRETELRWFTHRPNEAWQVAVYTARRIAGSELQTIGAYFGLGIRE